MGAVRRKLATQHIYTSAPVLQKTFFNVFVYPWHISNCNTFSYIFLRWLGAWVYKMYTYKSSCRSSFDNDK